MNDAPTNKLPTDEITQTLTRQDWSNIVHVLSQCPYSQVSELIEKIKKQMEKNDS